MSILYLTVVLLTLLHVLVQVVYFLVVVQLLLLQVPQLAFIKKLLDLVYLLVLLLVDVEVRLLLLENTYLLLQVLQKSQDFLLFHIGLVQNLQAVLLHFLVNAGASELLEDGVDLLAGHAGEFEDVLGVEEFVLRMG